MQIEDLQLPPITCIAAGMKKRFVSVRDQNMIDHVIKIATPIPHHCLNFKNHLAL